MTKTDRLAGRAGGCLPPRGGCAGKVCRNLPISIFVFMYFMGFLKIPKGAIYGAKITRDLVFSWYLHRGMETLKYQENSRSRVISAALMVPSGINQAREKQTQIFEAETEMLEYPPPPGRNPVQPPHRGDINPAFLRFDLVS